MKAHELAKLLLEQENLEVRIFTDHGQEYQLCDSVDIINVYAAESEEYSIDDSIDDFVDQCEATEKQIVIW